MANEYIKNSAYHLQTLEKGLKVIACNQLFDQLLPDDA